MATAAEWSGGYARQANADFNLFQTLQAEVAEQCHRLQLLQMACEKLAKAHLCGTGADPAGVQTSHAYVAKTLPVILKQTAIALNFTGPQSTAAIKLATRLAKEIELLSPAVNANGKRPDNCEYPWEDDTGTLHSPLDWAFTPSDLLTVRAGRTVLKLIREAIKRLLPAE